MGRGLGEIAAARIVAGKARDRDRTAYSFEDVPVGRVVVNAGAEPLHVPDNDVALDGMPGASGGRRLERAARVDPLRAHCCTPADSPVASPGHREQGLRRKSGARSGEPAAPRQTAPRLAAAASTVSRATIALDRLGHRRAAACARAWRAASRADQNRTSFVAVWKKPASGFHRSRAAMARARGSSGPIRTLQQRPRDEPPDERGEERQGGRARPQSRPGSSIRCSNPAAGRVTEAPGRVARSRSCGRPGDCPASRERGGGLAGTGAGPRDRHADLGNRKGHVRPANLLDLRRADVVDVGHPLADARAACRRAWRSHRGRRCALALSTASTPANCSRSFFSSTFFTPSRFLAFFAASWAPWRRLLRGFGPWTLRPLFFAGDARRAFATFFLQFERSTESTDSSAGGQGKGTDLPRNAELRQHLLESWLGAERIQPLGSTASHSRSGSRSLRACSSSSSARARSPSAS